LVSSFQSILIQEKTAGKQHKFKLSKLLCRIKRRKRQEVTGREFFLITFLYQSPGEVIIINWWERFSGSISSALLVFSGQLVAFFSQQVDSSIVTTEVARRVRKPASRISRMDPKINMLLRCMVVVFVCDESRLENVTVSL
jgi:hypothetical protein